MLITGCRNSDATALKCLSLNARSIINKIDAFTATVCVLDPDIIGVTESWSSADILDSELSLPGYVLYRCDRPSDHNGGGVLLYVKDYLKPQEYEPQINFPEHIWCKIKGKNGTDLTVGVCYRSNNASIYPDGNHKLLRELLYKTSSQHVLILGDFNYKEIDWNPVGPVPGTADCEAFVDCLEDNFYIQHVTVPTRDNSVLDLIISNDPELVSDVQVLNPLATSDHNMLMCCVSMDVNKSIDNKVRYDYNKADFDGIRKELDQINWNRLLEGDIHKSWKNFKEVLSLLESKYVPVKKPRQNKK